MSTTQHSLPASVIDPEDVQALVPGLSIEDATRAAQLATLALQAAVAPNALPDPLPPPLQQVGMTVAARIARAGDPDSQIVSESLGSYSKRLGGSTTPDSAMVLTEDEEELIAPWAPSDVFDVGTFSLAAWPAGWWQADLDNPLKASEEET